MRNQWIFNAVHISEKEVVDKGQQEWMEYKEAMVWKGKQQAGPNQPSGLQKAEQQWQSLKVGYHTLDTSSCCPKQSHRSAFGRLAQDHHGTLLQAQASIRQGNQDAR